MIIFERLRFVNSQLTLLTNILYVQEKLIINMSYGNDKNGESSIFLV